MGSAELFSKYNIAKHTIDFNSNSIFLAFDYGTKRIGAACGNLITKTAYKIGIYEYTTRLNRFSTLQSLINEYIPNYLVVGLPVHSDNTIHEMTRASCNFGLDLYRYFNLPVIWVDERYSTAILNKKYKQHIDDESAKIILEQFLYNANTDYFIR